MRFVVTDERPVTTSDLRDVMLGAGSGYELDADDVAGTISYHGAPMALVEINVPGDGLFDDEREELIEFAAEAEGDGRARVLEVLRNARTIVAAQILFGTGEAKSTLALVDPLWAWLFHNRQGLLQADGEGYYDQHGLVLQVG